MSSTNQYAKKARQLITEAIAYQTFCQNYDSNGGGFKEKNVQSSSDPGYIENVSVSGATGTTCTIYGPFYVSYVSGSGSASKYSEYYYFGKVYSRNLSVTYTDGTTGTLSANSKTWGPCDKNGNVLSSYGNKTFYIYVSDSAVSSKKIKSVDALNLVYRKSYCTGDLFLVDNGNAGQAWGVLAATAVSYKNTTTTITFAEKTKEITANLQIVKKDATDGSTISQMGFTIYDNKKKAYVNQNGEYVSNAEIVYTNYNGEINISGIAITDAETTFTVTEVASENAYYKADNSIKYTISKTSESDDGSTITYTYKKEITNTKAYSLTIDKEDKDTGDDLKATFIIKYEGEEATTSEDTSTEDDSSSEEETTTSENTSTEENVYSVYVYYYDLNESNELVLDGPYTQQVEEGTYKLENIVSAEYASYVYIDDGEQGCYKWVSDYYEINSDITIYGYPYDYEAELYTVTVKYINNDSVKRTKTIELQEPRSYTINEWLSLDETEYVKYITIVDEEYNEDDSYELSSNITVNVYYDYYDEEEESTYTVTVNYYDDDGNIEETQIKEDQEETTYYINEWVDETADIGNIIINDGLEYVEYDIDDEYYLYTDITISVYPEGYQSSSSTDDDPIWLSIDGTTVSYGTTKSEITVDGELTISGIQRGVYHIYEVESPYGYDITQQEGYDSNNKWVDCGTVYVGINENYEQDNTVCSVSTTISNEKFVKKISGFVWVDTPIGKANVGNNLYDESEELLAGIEVSLYSVNSNTPIATTSTLSNGKYQFKLSSQVKYWDLADYYIQFTYNNKEYIVLDPFVTGDDSSIDYDAINSKAQEEEMLQEELEDENLTGEGYAVTIKNASKLTTKGCLANYYSNDTYEITGINLGLLEKVDPTYSITETLSYVYIEMNGYTYTYYFDGSADESRTYNSDNVPTVAKQTTGHTYSVSVYPSDIAATKENPSAGMQVYVVYGIYVYNSTTLTDDDNYYEKTLYLSSLTNAYDTSRFVLSDANSGDDSLVGSSDFGLWSDSSSGNATYKLYNDNGTINSDSAYRSGVSAGCTIKSYIQFQVTQTTLEKLLTGDSSLNQTNAASIATAEGFHEYQRTDNLWVQTTSSENRKYADCIGDYDSTNSSKEYYYTHKSEPEENSSGALSINLKLTSERMISGVVYQDVSQESIDSSGNEIQTGNGIIDDEETNRGQTVTVKLLSVPDVSNLNDYDNYETATLYQLSSSDSSGYKITNAECKTTLDEDTGYGYYEFVGVIPGYYYIEFTYGDGTQTIVDTNGNVVDQLTSNDYRSTIINTDGEGTYIQNAMEGNYSEYDTTYSSAEDVKNALIEYYAGDSTDTSAQKIAEWYKYLDENTNYNTAVDNLDDRSAYNNYTYTEVGIYDGDDLIIEYVYTDDVITSMVDVSTGETIGTYDTDGNITYTGNGSYPYTINSYTPLTSISIENDKKTYNNTDEDSDENTHEVEYSGFNFGVVEQPKSETIITKTIENVDITLQNGSTLVSCNIAEDESSKYVSILDSLHQYVKAEMDSDLIYGSGLEITYKIEAENASEIDYLEADSDYYGYYYKYGIVTSSAVAKTITVNEVIDDIDEKYDLDIEKLSYTTSKSGMTVESASESDTHEDSTTTTNSISITGWGEFSIGESATITYTVSSLLNSNSADTLYDNTTRVTSISLTELTTLTSSYIWGERTKTQFTIYPSTGGDMRSILIITSVIGLTIASAGFVLIKKKVLK